MPHLMRGGDYGWLGALGYSSPVDLSSNIMAARKSKVHGKILHTDENSAWCKGTKRDYIK